MQLTLQHFICLLNLQKLQLLCILTGFHLLTHRNCWSLLPATALSCRYYTPKSKRKPELAKESSQADGQLKEVLLCIFHSTAHWLDYNWGF